MIDLAARTGSKRAPWQIGDWRLPQFSEELVTSLAQALLPSKIRGIELY